MRNPLKAPADEPRGIRETGGDPVQSGHEPEPPGESGKRFRSIVEGSPDAVFLVDTKTGDVLDANAAAERLLGLPRRKIVGLHHERLHPPRVRTSAGEGFARIVQDAEPIPPTRTAILRPDGTERVCEVVAHLVHVRERPLVLAAFRDITEREQAARELRKDQSLTEAVFQSVPGPTYLVDEQGTPVRWNRRLEDVSGYSTEEMACMHALDFYAEEDRERIVQLIREATHRGYADTEATVLTKSGARIPFFFSAVPLRIEGKRYVTGVGIDLTRRKGVEEALRESLDTSRALLDAIQDVAMLIDAQGRIVAGNQPMAERHGRTAEEIAGLSAFDLLPPEVAEGRLTYFRQALDSGRVVRFEDENGGRFFESVCYPVFDEKGQVAKVAVLARDVTEQRCKDQRLREGMETWKVFFNAVPALALVVDTRGNIIEANRHFAGRFGKTPPELAGVCGWDLIPPEVVERRKRYFRQVLDSGRPVRFEDERDGTWFENISAPILDEKGEVTRVALLARDITEEKRARQALEASEQRYRVIVENQTELICRSLPDGTITFVNGAYCRCFGKTSSELVGGTFMPFIPPEDRRKVEDLFASLTPEKPVATIEHRVVVHDGTVRWHQWTNQALHDGQGRLVEYQAVGRDVTERKQLDKEFARIEKLESLGVLAGGIAHDFNNMLTGITTNVSMAQTFGDLSDEVADMLADAETAAWQAKGLTRQLLTFSKGGTPVRRPMPVARLIRETTGFALSGSNVRCEYHLPAELWVAEIDEGQICQVVQNLVINAQQAMPEGGTIRVSAENVVIGADEPVPLEPGRYVRISVKDQGTGIPAKHLPKIFDPFFTTKHQGSGLGLAICFSIVKGHEGHIRVDSVLGEGTAFDVYLRASHDETADSREEGAGLLQGEGRILIVDDDERIVRSAGKALRLLGYEAEPVQSGEAALERYASAMAAGRPFQAVILDLTLPGGMGGREAMEALRKIDPQARVVASSGYSNDPVLSDFRRFGFTGVLTKPYKIADLGAVLRRVIRGEGA